MLNPAKCNTEKNPTVEKTQVRLIEFI